jgi:hypothetical protein
MVWLPSSTFFYVDATCIDVSARLATWLGRAAPSSGERIQKPSPTTLGDIDRLQQSPPINFASAWMNMWAKVFGSVRLMKALLVPTK